MNVIMILVDSLNRHYLSPYGNQWIKTPNIQRLANEGVAFDNHFISAAPCMPARRAMLCGRNEFLWRSWGPTEPFDNHLSSLAKSAGAATAMVTDHYHYWEYFAHGYTETFDCLEMIRGHELDMYRTDLEREVPEWVKSIDKWRSGLGERYYKNVQDIQEEEDYFAPRVMSAGAKWLEKNKNNDKVFLVLESFDCHEPFHVPEPYRSMYTDDFSEEYTCWPPYQLGEHGHREDFWKNTSQEEIDFIRSQYAGKVTMTDKWLGEVFDVMDKNDMWKDTMVVLTTDHGHELGEKQRFGKQFPHYDLNAHIPLIVYHPSLKNKGIRKEGFTSAVDIYPTILEALGAQGFDPVDGKSLLPVINGEKESIRDYVFYGSFASGANITTKEYTYVQGYDNSHPLYQYSCSMFMPGMNGYEKAESGRFMPGIDIPLWKIPIKTDPKDSQPNYLWDRQRDPKQEHNIVEEEPQVANKLRSLLIDAMEELGCPPEQYVRMGLEEK